MSLRPALLLLPAALLSTPSVAAPPDADVLGLEALPDRPERRRVGEPHQARMDRIDAGELMPERLVPFAARPYVGARFYDEAGTVYRYREAVAVLAEACPDEVAPYLALRGEADTELALHHTLSAVDSDVGDVFLFASASTDEQAADALIEVIRAYHQGTCSG